MFLYRVMCQRITLIVFKNKKKVKGKSKNIFKIASRHIIKCADTDILRLKYINQSPNPFIRLAETLQCFTKSLRKILQLQPLSSV